MGRDLGPDAGTLSIELVSVGLIGFRTFSHSSAPQMSSDDEVHRHTRIRRRAVASRLLQSKHNRRIRRFTPQFGARF